MKGKSIAILILSIYLTCCTIILAKDNELVQIKGNMTQYNVKLHNEMAMLSRDGSMAYSVKDGEIIQKPGMYYLTRTSKDGKLSIEQFTIPYRTQTTAFRVSNDMALEEAFKQILEQKSTQITIQMNYGNYTFEALCEKIKYLLNKIVDSYPALSYTEYSISSSAGNKPFITMTIEYPIEDTQLFKQYDAKAKAMISAILNSILKPYMKDYEREWVLYDYVAKHLTYAEDLNLKITHTLQGGLVDKIAVCDGYAKTLMYLLNSTGIPTTIVTGNTGTIGHAWNMVMIQNQRYHVDATWGDQDGNQIGNFYDYFNETDIYMAQTHTWDRTRTKPATQVLYSSIYMPINLPNVYRMPDAKAWEVLRENLKKDNSRENTLIFYNKNLNKWQKDKLFRQIAEFEEAAITYTIIEKYDALIIQYRVEK